MKKKILFVINTLGQGGAEVAMLELFRHLDQEKYEISLYVLLGQGELVNCLQPHINLLNKKYKDISVLSKRGRRIMCGTILRAALRRGSIIRRLPYLVSNLVHMIREHKIWPEKLLWKILSDGGMNLAEEYDLAIAFLEGGSAYYVADHVKAAKKAAFIHIDYGRAGYTRKLDQGCYQSFDRIFAVSNEVRDHFLKAYPECKSKTEVFRNMINQERIKLMSWTRGGFEDRYQGTRILSVGRLTYQKSYHIAVETLRLLKDDGIEARWYVLGEGSLRGQLEKQIVELNLKGEFRLLGVDTNPYPYYQQCDIYVHASRFEGKSIAIQEAQTLGCAIVASDCSGNREQIEDGVDGLLCPLSSEQLKEHIERLIKDDELRERLGEAARKKQIVHEEDLQMLLTLID